METIRQKLLAKYWKKAFDFATELDYDDIDNAEDRYKKWMEIQELYRIAVKEVIDDICSNYEVQEKKAVHNMKVNSPKSIIIPENEMDELGLRKDIHPNNLRCSKCGCYDVLVYLDVDGSGCRKKVKCKDDQCGFIWVVQEYGK